MWTNLTRTHCDGIDFKSRSSIGAFIHDNRVWRQIGKMHFRHIALQAILCKAQPLPILRVEPSFLVWWHSTDSIQDVTSIRFTIFQEIQGWVHRRSYHIENDMQDVSSKLSAGQNMSRMQRFSLVLDTWPCRLLKSKNRNESLLLIVIVPLKWFIERLSYSRNWRIDIFRDKCVSWSWYWDDHNAEKEGSWFIF